MEPLNTLVSRQLLRLQSPSHYQPGRSKPPKPAPTAPQRTIALRPKHGRLPSQQLQVHMESRLCRLLQEVVQISPHGPPRSCQLQSQGFLQRLQASKTCIIRSISCNNPSSVGPTQSHLSAISGSLSYILWRNLHHMRPAGSLRNLAHPCRRCSCQPAAQQSRRRRPPCAPGCGGAERSRDCARGRCHEGQEGRGSRPRARSQC